MTELRQRMVEDTRPRGLSARTREVNARSVRQLAEHYGRSPDLITEEELRGYFLHLVEVKKVARPSLTIALCGIKFFYRHTVQRDWNVFGGVCPPKAGRPRASDPAQGRGPSSQERGSEPPDRVSSRGRPRGRPVDLGRSILMTRVPPAAKPAFLLGVTGRMSFPGYSIGPIEPGAMTPAERAIYDRVGAVLDWLRCGEAEGALDPRSGRFDPGLRCSAKLAGDALPPWWRPWRARFEACSRDARRELLHAVRVAWVRDQLHYARKEAIQGQERAHRWHGWGWALAAAGAAVLTRHVLLALRDAREDGYEDHDHDREEAPGRGFVGWILRRRLRWGYGLLMGAAAFWAPHGLARLTTQWPDAHGWWIILTGVPLLCGALCLAWSERNFHGEIARTNRAFEGLFESADRRLEALIARYGALAPEDPAAARTLEEIRSILYELRREALSENAEWLILRRARPPEPFMAG